MSETAATFERQDALRGISAMLLSVLVFGLMAALVKLATAQQPIGQVIFFRNAFAFIPLYVVVRRAGGFRALRTRHVREHVVRVIARIASMALIFSAYAVMPLADVVAIGLSAPIFLTCLSVPMLGENVGWRRWIAVGAGFIGILIITRPDSEVFDPVALVPLGAAVFYAVAMIQIRKVGIREPAATMTFYYTLCSALLAAASLPWQWVTPTPSMLVCVIAIGLLGGVAQLAVTEAYRLAPVSLIAPFEYTALLVAAAFGYAIWGQIPDRFIWLGAAVVAASSLYIARREAVRRERAG